MISHTHNTVRIEYVWLDASGRRLAGPPEEPHKVVDAYRKGGHVVVVLQALTPNNGERK